MAEGLDSPGGGLDPPEDNKARRQQQVYLGMALGVPVAILLSRYIRGYAMYWLLAATLIGLLLWKRYVEIRRSKRNGPT